MELKSLHTFLDRRLDRPFELRLNDNHHNLLTVVRPRARPVRVSVHRMFLQAPRDVLASLVDFISGPTPDSRAAIRRFICENRSKIGVSPARKLLVRPQPVGKHFDLRRIADQINRAYFAVRLKFDITWGRRPANPPRELQHIQLGNYNERQRLIRIHPILDGPLVPKYYLAYIVYHEMVHIVVPPQVDERGRVCHHTRRFYALEKKYADYERAVQWQTQRLGDLVAFYCSRPKRRVCRQLTLF